MLQGESINIDKSLEGVDCATPAFIAAFGVADKIIARSTTYCCLYGVSMDTVCFHGNTLHFAATAAEIGNEHGEEI